MEGFVKYLTNYNVFLASGSPRRRSLLESAGIPFQVWLKEEIEESIPPDLDPFKVAQYLAKVKSDNYFNDLNHNDILIAADTTVILGNEILGKPSDHDEAYMMLKKLSGVYHDVVTGVCLRSIDQEIIFDATSRVWFEELSDEEIHYYIDHFHPFDKAGSYGIQEWIGYIAIGRIEGSFFNVMGLPVQRLYQEIKKITHYK